MSNGLWIGDAYAHGPGECEPEYASLWDGLVCCWVPQMGPTGNRLVDLSGYGNHGVLTNMDPATDWVTGPDGWNLSLDGSDDYIITSQPIIPFYTGSAIISYTNWTNTGPSHVIGCYNTLSADGGWALSRMDSKHLRFTLFRRADYLSPLMVPDAGGIVGCSFVNGKTATLAENGDIWTTAIGYAYSYSPGLLMCGGRKSTLASGISGVLRAEIGMVAVWTRALPNNVLSRLTSDDPLCFLRPRRRWWAVPAAAAGVYRVRRYHDRLYAPGLNPGVM